MNQRLQDAIAVTPEVPDRYARRGVLGVGGIGIVELAYDRHLGREIAIKRLKPTLSREDSLGRDATRRFLKEARLGALLEHPNIVPVYELGRRADGGLYYTMKRIRGRTLAEALEGADLAERLAFLPHVIAVCNAMAYAHEHGVIHRDLKPDNVMVDAHGEALVVDWGLACERGADDVQSRALAQELEALRKASGTQTVTGAPIGTPAYMPPEQARGELKAIDERSDVYTLGAILYELLTGEPPFTGQSALHILRRVLDAEPVEQPDALEPEAPPELAAVALRALAKDPIDRYPDAAALAADLVAFQTGARVAAHAYGRGALAWRWLKTHRLGVGVACLLIVAAGLTWWTRGVSDARNQVEASAVEAAAHVERADAIIEDARQGRVRPERRDVWAFRLASMPSAAVGRRLIEALGDPAPQVRVVAARALAAQDGAGDPRAVDALLAHLEREEILEVQIAIIQTLGVLGDRRAEPAIRKARRAAGLDSQLWRATVTAHQLMPDTANAESLEARGQYAAALQAYDAAVQAKPTVASLAGRARMAWRLGRLTPALADVNAAAALAPPDRQLLVSRAQLHYELEAWDDALRDLNALIDAGDTSAELLRLRAWTYLATGDTQAALDDIQTATLAAPDDGATHLGRGRLLLMLGSHRAAQLAVSKAIALTGETPAALRLRARTHWRRGARAPAIADLERVLTENPNDSAALTQLATYQRLKGDANAAARLLTQALRRTPGAPTLLLARATLHAARGDLRAALADLDAAKARALTADLVGLYALAVAAEFESGEALAARVAALSTKADSPWVRDLVRVLRGEIEPDALTGRTRHVRARACEAALVQATRARLLGDRIAADDLLSAAVRLPDPDDVPCALVRALDRR
ncbi:MAG: tetratricopeptide (TPR) repeat protein/tRNA A-37 threonylcarbamoyl transferase component Bud32 [Bradymonadia bacterium]|jgi:tetratricopeptide (TPR) repeat protein/tRNA A-37 threonylcarbamoyl transferase component Bud32